MNILIVEDDRILASQIARTFARRVLSNRIDIVEDMRAFREKIPSMHMYDIILVDMILQTVSIKVIEGYDILKILQKYDLPIIVMSGIDDVGVLAQAFELGALDYICKPFRIEELEVRIDHWFQRFYMDRYTKQDLILQKDLSYDLKSSEFTIEGKVIPLSRMEKYIMSLFIREPGKTFSYQHLREKIWGDREYTAERNIRVPIMRLRRSLMPFSLDNWITTLPGEGYRFDPR